MRGRVRESKGYIFRIVLIIEYLIIEIRANLFLKKTKQKKNSERESKERESKSKGEGE